MLLDRTVAAYPAVDTHDLVGIDNRRAGYLITEHLLRLGARRIAFVTRRHAAATVAAREPATARRSNVWDTPVERTCAPLEDRGSDQVRLS